MKRIEKLQGVVLMQAKGIVENGGEWKKFLDNACYTNKYAFENQLLIYSQKSNVTAVAEFDLWNNRFNRMVKKGTKGIPIVEFSGNKRVIKHVFDISDTHRTRNTVNDVQLWAFDDTKHGELFTRLGVGTNEEVSPLSYQESVERYVNGKLDISSVTESVERVIGTKLSETEAESLEAIVQQTLSYMVMNRMGIHSAAQSYYEEKTNKFSEITSLSYSFATLNEITTTIMKDYTGMSQEISRVISELDIENERQENIQNKVGKSLHETSNASYSMRNEIGALETNASDVKTQNDDEGVGHNDSSDGRGKTVPLGERGLHARSEGVEFRENGGNVQDGGRNALSDDRMGGRSRAEEGREIRGNEKGVPEGSEAVSLSDDGVGRDIDGPSVGSGRTGGNTDGNDGGSDDEETGSDGGTEGTGSNEMGARGERHQEDVRRSDLSGIDSRLEDEDEEQLNLFGVEEEPKAVGDTLPSAFSIEENNINSVLRKGSDTENGKFRITELYEGDSTNAEKVAFLKNEYGLGGWSVTEGKVWYSPSGIKIEYWDEDQGSQEVNLTWSNVSKRLEELIAKDLYLDAEEKEEMDRWKNATNPVPKVEEEQKENIVVPESITQEVERSNFRIEDDSLGVAGAKEKYQWNIEALQTLEIIEKENRLATPEEQEILSRYVGWGGLSDAFDENKPAWSREYQELKGILTDEEYSSARASTLNAHYTSPVIIDSMYEAIGNMGFTTGNVLEPSVGVGNFFGLLPKSMENSKLYGVELDDLTGRIAKQLYQKSDITIDGFENADLPDNFFDVAVGNVPFGQYKLSDKKYDKNNFLIHDYFFAKSLDKVRAGGVVAFITSKGTMDKEGEDVRKYLGERADLIGAIRLPNNAFKANAGTEVTSDILFLQKRERLAVVEPDWVKLGENEDGIRMNQYFVDNPHMVLGKMEMKSGRFGEESTCTPLENVSLKEQLSVAIGNLNEVTLEKELLHEDEQVTTATTVPSDPTVRNFSYTVLGEEIYFRENSIMTKQDIKKSEDVERVKALIVLRDTTRELIKYQSEDYSDDMIKNCQVELNELYDAFSSKYGRINERKNQKAFENDSSLPLLSALEIMDSENKFKRKADIFSKRTIRKHVLITEVDTVNEALALSINEKAKVDLDYMANLTGKEPEMIAKELKGVIFLDPHSNQYETADAFLSGNIRKKLKDSQVAKNNLVQSIEELNNIYPVDEEEKLHLQQKIEDLDLNIKALEQVMPEDLKAVDITTRLGATWIPSQYVQEFMYETLQTPNYAKFDIKVSFSERTSTWNVSAKSSDNNNVLATSTYGTTRINAYRIIEDTLNLKDVRIMDSVVADNGKLERVLNHKETTLAQQKQEALKEKFSEWLWEQPQRRNRLLKIYNERFNSVRTREYDGSHLTFPGMNPEISLKDHQKNVVAHTLYGGNTLMAHVVGAGKTYSCIASVMESKRLGLSQKSLIVVPNHLTEQWGADFLELYPSANVLVATKKDFEPSNRKKFCGRIATGEYDAVIIGHTQFERIPLSEERQKMEIKKQIEDITNGIAAMKHEIGKSFSIKEAERTKKALDARLKKLNDQSIKDDVVTFEELGVDRLFVDEAHSYKNLFLYTKMQNVAGIGNREAKKSSDMFMKCRYMDEITGGKGVVFATGTPVSNSMTELYTMQRYLQYDKLEELGLESFDSWASTFGESVTAIELAPEGTGFRQKTRFAKFYNLPELMSVFKEIADIQTSDMLDLPVPESELKVVVTKPSEMQEDMVRSLSERADSVRSKSVDPTVDNMLKITNDGRKLALDQRIMNPLLPDDENSKVSECARNVFAIWDESKEKKSTQLVFCDLSTPKKDGSFNVYDDIKEKLLNSGIPEDEIAFIHDAKTDKQKDVLFAKVRKGEVRVLIGSTEKMGAGTNVQDKLIALHDLDCPWRPSDLEQRMGRIVRQGNENEKVLVFRYVTENTFDSYSYQLIENKQKFISQIMTSKSPVRSANDVDDSTLSYAEIKALATGNPLIKEKMDLDTQVTKLKMLKSSFVGEKHKLENDITQRFPKRITKLSEKIKAIHTDIQYTKENTKNDIETNFSPMKVGDTLHRIKEDAGAALLDVIAKKEDRKKVEIGEYRGLKMELFFDSFQNGYMLELKNEGSYEVELGKNPVGNITRIDNLIKSLPDRLVSLDNDLDNTKRQVENAKVELEKPFLYEEELAEKESRLVELEKEINTTFDKKESHEEKDVDKKKKDYDRS